MAESSKIVLKLLKREIVITNILTKIHITHLFGSMPLVFVDPDELASNPCSGLLSFNLIVISVQNVCHLWKSVGIW